jgi:hypothetical protein
MGSAAILRAVAHEKGTPGAVIIELSLQGNVGRKGWINFSKNLRCDLISRLVFEKANF